jgi:hypothetical protein
MTPEGKVKIWGRYRLDKHLEGHWQIMPQGNALGNKNGQMDYVGMWEGVPFAIEYKANLGDDATPLQWSRLNHFGRMKGFICVMDGKNQVKMDNLIAAIKGRAERIKDLLWDE